MFLTKKDIDIVTSYINIRNKTNDLCLPLKTEDYVLQPMKEVSPPKWHLAHTTWFLENFVLKKHKKNYRVFHPQYHYLFNSYYDSEGDRVPRANRGNLSRPTVEEIYNYRQYVDEHILEFMENCPEEIPKEIIALGLNHEQQHQELLLTDIKFILAQNPLRPAYKNGSEVNTNISTVIPEEYLPVEEGVYTIGHEGDGFCFDNEKGRHKVYIHPFQFSNRLVTNKEYIEFMDAGGYQNFRHWLQEGWEWIKTNRIEAPLYWGKIDNEWYQFTLSGFKKVVEEEPVTHISYYEADAYASWKKKRLLTEAEWEVATQLYEVVVNANSNFLENGLYHPQIAQNNSQFFGDCWEWTSSAYLPYPYYKKEEGALGEYNGKFMINQMILRGGSCVTPEEHIRDTYRNFFHPDKRWQFTGIRLAESY
ncbi:MAG TPA: ergothioneine biosynthesis protein EgtB [Cytophagaceae bacterium]